MKITHLKNIDGGLILNQVVVLNDNNSQLATLYGYNINDWKNSLATQISMWENKRDFNRSEHIAFRRNVTLFDKYCNSVQMCLSLQQCYQYLLSGDLILTF